MKLAWLCYSHNKDDKAVILFYKPPSYLYDKVVPIVYAEIVE